MKIVGINGSERMRFGPVDACAGLAILVVVAVGGGRLHGVAAARAEEGGAKREQVTPAADPAEVQRRQQIKQQAAHWEQQLTKVFYGDLELIRNLVGDIPREARRPIVQAGEKAVKEAAVRLAELQFGGPRRGAEADGQPADDPTELVSMALAERLSEHVGREHAAAFTEQIVERRERRRRAAVREIVAVLDGELVFTAVQREQIARSLDERWNDAMAVSLEGMHWADGRRVFPGLPAECIVPHLTDAQRSRFTSRPNGREGADAGAAVSRRTIWARMNVLNNVHSAPRDPWWFQ